MKFVGTSTRLPCRVNLAGRLPAQHLGRGSLNKGILKQGDLLMYQLKRSFWIALSLAAAFMLALPVLARAATIDFEGFALGGATFLDVGPSLSFSNVEGSGVDVTINEGADNRIYDLFLFGSNPLATGQALIDWNWPSGSNTVGTEILFSTSVLSFSLEAGDFGGDDDSPLTITAYDIGGNLVASDSASWSSNPPFSLLSVSAPGIRRVVFQSGGTFANSIFIDNLTFAIPEPSTALLLMTGLLGLAVRQRRRA